VNELWLVGLDRCRSFFVMPPDLWTVAIRFLNLKGLHLHNNKKKMHEEDLESFDAACARSDAKLMAAMVSCCPRFQTGEEQAAHYAREAKEVKAATARKVKTETPLEMFRRISEARDAKTVKAAASAAKKSVKQKKTKRLSTYYLKSK
jgi:hypothetical protein